MTVTNVEHVHLCRVANNTVIPYGK